MQCVECIEKLLLCCLFSFKELDIVDQKDIDSSVFCFEFPCFMVSQCFDQFVGEHFRWDVQDIQIREMVKQVDADRVHKMGFPESGTAVNKQRVVGLWRGFRDRDRRGVGVFITVSDNKIVKVISRIEYSLFGKSRIVIRRRRFVSMLLRIEIDFNLAVPLSRDCSQKRFFFCFCILFIIFIRRFYNHTIGHFHDRLKAVFQDAEITVFQDIRVEFLVCFQVDDF